MGWGAGAPYGWCIGPGAVDMVPGGGGWGAGKVYAKDVGAVAEKEEVPGTWLDPPGDP